jgi:hypothetical protein
LRRGGVGAFVLWLAAPIASGGCDPCRVGLAPTEDRRLFAAHPIQPFGVGAREPFHPWYVGGMSVQILEKWF